MAIEFAFIEQIAGRSALHYDAGPPTNIFEAVKEHLILLLNTRRGSVRHLPDYGLPDLSEIYKTYPDSLISLGHAIRETVMKYEPRIANIRVDLVSSSSKFFEVNYNILGNLVVSDKEIKAISFSTIVTQNGHIKVGS